ncbi:MAG: hypothetical protein M1839_008783 [Geoglossum umbratile]|nr:MAG: hypothetical protein M1839_008783 [Geoglossum umbratile]
MANPECQTCGNLGEFGGASEAYKPSVRELLGSATNGCRYCHLVLDVVTAIDADVLLDYRNPDTNILSLVVAMAESLHIYINKGGKKLLVDCYTPQGLNAEAAHRSLPLLLDVEPVAGSKTNLLTARKWMEECFHDHPKYKNHKCPVAAPTALPKRIIHIITGDGKSSVLKLKLLDSEETLGVSGMYVALSYSWGRVQPLKTEKATLRERKQDISWSTLPKTFQDAVTVANFLGFSYIWIDSLCIVQDDSSDWDEQAALMANIYENAAFAILAVSAASSHDGFLKVRPRLAEGIAEGTVLLAPKESCSSPIPIRFRLELGHYDIGMNWALGRIQDPLSFRAWAFQERMLAKRALIFSTYELLWECHSIGWKCECGFGDWGYNHQYNMEESRTGGSLLDSRTIFQHWRESIIRDYTKKRLTYGSDKLPALSGVADIVQRRTKDQYIAGLWKKDILNCLCWRVSCEPEDPIRQLPLECVGVMTEEYRAPSFSWASVDNEIHYLPGMARWTAQLTDLHSIHVGLNPLGRVSDAWITLDGLVAPAWVRLSPCDPDWKTNKLQLRILQVFEPGIDGSGVCCSFYPDVKLEPSPMRGGSNARRTPNSFSSTWPGVQRARSKEQQFADGWYFCWCLQLSDVPYSFSRTLILGCSHRGPGVLERLGLMQTLNLSSLEWTERWKKATRMRVTIV